MLRRLREGIRVGTVVLLGVLLVFLCFACKAVDKKDARKESEDVSELLEEVEKREDLDGTSESKGGQIETEDKESSEILAPKENASEEINSDEKASERTTVEGTILEGNTSNEDNLEKNTSSENTSSENTSEGNISGEGQGYYDEYGTFHGGSMPQESTTKTYPSSPQWLYYNSISRNPVTEDMKEHFDLIVNQWTNGNYTDDEVARDFDGYIYSCGYTEAELPGYSGSGGYGNRKFLVDSLETVPNGDEYLQGGFDYYTFYAVYTNCEQDEYGHLICYSWSMSF